MFGWEPTDVLEDGVREDRVPQSPVTSVSPEAALGCCRLFSGAGKCLGITWLSFRLSNQSSGGTIRKTVRFAISRRVISAICFSDTWVLFADFQRSLQFASIDSGRFGGWRAQRFSAFLLSCGFCCRLATSNLPHQIPADLALGQVVSKLTEELSNSASCCLLLIHYHF